MPSPESSSHPVEIRSAVIGAVAALLAAALGGVITGIPVLISTNAQIAANSQEARSQFLRDERKGAYADLLAKSDAYRKSADALMQIIGAGESQERRAERQRHWNEAASELLSSVNSVKLVASHEVSAVADQLILQRNEYDSTVATLASVVGESVHMNFENPTHSDMYNVVFHRSEKYDEVHSEFLRAARRDLGVDLPR